MLLDEIKNIKSSDAELRDFGIVVGGVFAIAGLLKLLYSSLPVIKILPIDVAVILIHFGILLLLLGILAPIALTYMQKAWMALALCIGWFMGGLLLSVFYLGPLTFIAFLLKISRKELLNLETCTKTDTYWHKRPIDEDLCKASENQF